MPPDDDWDGIDLPEITPVNYKILDVLDDIHDGLGAQARDLKAIRQLLIEIRDRL